MSWFKDFFIRKDSQAQSIPAPIKRKPDISEPVISFVETFKANPKRFKVIKSWDSLAITSCIHSFNLKDKYNNLEWNFSISTRHYSLSLPAEVRLWSYPSFLTKDEANFIYNELKEEFSKRRERLVLLEVKRRKRIVDKEREALKKVYCRGSA